MWKDSFINISNKHAPLKQKRLKNRSNPWITPDIVKMIYKRNYYHKKAVSSKNETCANEYWVEYKKLRNSITKNIRAAKLKHYTEMTTLYRTSPKQLWAHIKQAMPKPSHDNINDISADSFNDFFSSIGEKVAAKINNSNVYPDLTFPNSIYSFKFDLIREEFILKILEKLPNKSKNDILGFDTKLLNLSAEIITPSLQLLINASLKSGFVPKDWKLARVVPAFKGKGEINDENSYRPLSVIAHIAKIAERCVYKQLSTYLYNHSFISKDQFAYLQNSSTQHCLHRLVDDILDNMNCNEKTALCFIDIRKCFDTINHDILIEKMKKYGIRNTELDWFRSYLSNRSQIVFHNNKLSSTRKVNIGVPQGTILGPVLFLLYINDLPNVLPPSSQMNIFADDVVIYCSHNDVNCLKNDIQHAVNNVHEWYKRNKLSLSLEKCECMVINSNPLKQIENFCINLGENTLTQVHMAKYLGVTIDDKFKWFDHLRNLAKKVNINNSRLRKLSKTLPLHIRLQLHNAINIPTIDYASTVWGDFNEYVNDFITRLEHRCARAVSGNYDFINVRGASIMSDLNMSSFKNRNKYNKSVLMYKAIQGLAPDFLLNYLTFTSEISHHNLRSCDTLELYVPKPNIEKFKKSLLYSGPKLWNTLPLVLKQAKSVKEFKLLYKKIMTV
jgi:hypothetical protein